MYVGVVPKFYQSERPSDIDVSPSQTTTRTDFVCSYCEMSFETLHVSCVQNLSVSALLTRKALCLALAIGRRSVSAVEGVCVRPRVCRSYVS